MLKNAFKVVAMKLFFIDLPNDDQLIVKMYDNLNASNDMYELKKAYDKLNLTLNKAYNRLNPLDILMSMLYTVGDIQYSLAKQPTTDDQIKSAVIRKMVDAKSNTISDAKLFDLITSTDDNNLTKEIALHKIAFKSMFNQVELPEIANLMLAFHHNICLAIEAEMELA